MRKLWNDLQYQPVLVATVVSTGATGLAGATDHPVIAVFATMTVAIAGGITRHYTNSRKHVRELGHEDTSRRLKGL